MIYTNRNIFVDKVINQILFRKNKIWRRIDPANASVRLMGTPMAADAFMRRLQFVLGNPGAVDLSGIDAAEKERIIYHADKTMAHEFNYLGSGWKKIDPIDWHTDYIWGHHWEPGKFYRDYTKISPNGGFDIKTMWDFSRSHHLLWLAEAYMITGKKKYAAEVVSQITNWIVENPLMYSINWTCSMDVAIRAVNWMYAIAMIESSGCLSESFIESVEKNIYEHGFFIINNLEKSVPNSGNHYSSDLTGLLFIFSLFPKNFFAKLTFNFALKEYKRELLIQISEDGTSYEHSVSYHRLVSELFVIPVTMLSRLGIELSEKHIHRLCGAISYIENYSRMSAAPLVGDNDNGRLLPLTPRDYRDHRYMLSIARSVLGYTSESEPHITAESEIISACIAEPIEVRITPSEIYPDNGCAILHNALASLFVTNSGFSFGRDLKIGRVYSTHTHPDALSFDLVVGGKELFVDPGTGVYTSKPELRNELRATANHNTICFDGLNQYGFLAGRMFNGVGRISERVLTLPNLQTVQGSYTFDCKEIRAKHSRTFELAENRLIITDKISTSAQNNVCLNFHLHPEVKVEGIGDISLLSCGECTVSVRSEIDGKALSPALHVSKYSPSYGVIKDSKNLTFNFKARGTEKISTIIAWERNKC